jgi:hypothetical protein
MKLVSYPQLREVEISVELLVLETLKKREVRHEPLAFF